LLSANVYLLTASKIKPRFVVQDYMQQTDSQSIKIERFIICYKKYAIFSEDTFSE